MHRSHRRRAPLALAAALLMLLAVASGVSLTSPSTASACPIQGCHVPPDDPPPPPPGPPAPPAPKWRISILSIHPYQTEDGFEDEAYIRINGSKVWSHDITALQTLYPNVTRDVSGPSSIALYDEDWPDPDDWLGTVSPSLPAAVGSSYATPMHFWGDGAHYEMLVQVSRLS